MASMKVLIVFAHQDRNSFNGALKDVAMETLRGEGHRVTVSDLYKTHFDAAATGHQFQGSSGTETFDYTAELQKAAKNSLLPEYLQHEVDKLLEAELVIIQCPVYWLGLPAIMKGWIDQVLEVFFRPNFVDMFENSPLAGKKIMLSLTTGHLKGAYSNTGISGDMDVVLWPIQKALHTSGFQVLAPQISYAVRRISHEERQNLLDSWKQRVKNIFKELPLAFIHPMHFDDDGRLSDEYVKSYNAERSPSSGQNMGRGFLKGCCTGETENGFQ